jgi:TIR domain
MAVLFVSHSSRDDAMARSLEAWLDAKGFDDRFVDHSDIDAGEKWAQALRDAAGACRVVVCLVTENWLASDPCFGEFSWWPG